MVNRIIEHLQHVRLTRSFSDMALIWSTCCEMKFETLEFTEVACNDTILGAVSLAFKCGITQHYVPNIHKVINEMPGSVLSGPPCTYRVFHKFFLTLRISICCCSFIILVIKATKVGKSHLKFILFSRGTCIFIKNKLICMVWARDIRHDRASNMNVENMRLSRETARARTMGMPQAVAS